MTKEIWSQDSAAGSTFYVDLPTDYPIRKLLVQSWHDNEEPDIVISSLKLSEEHDKRIVVDESVMNLIRMVESRVPRYQEMLSGKTGSSVTFYVTPHKDITISPIGADSTVLDLYHTWSGGGAKVIDAATDGMFHALVTGRCPAGAVPLFFGKQDVIEDWYDVTRLNSVRLKIVQGSSFTADTAATVDVITQQMRSY